jgi:hypothetical protein
MSDEPKVEVPKVYAAIAAVQADLSKMGLAKDEKNAFQKYNFRGIDALMCALSPLLVKHGLVILPVGLQCFGEERTTKDGKASHRAIVDIEYNFICVEDGSTVTAGPFYGEATDTSDKATNKAMSAAYKYMAFQTFCIPVKGQDEGDSDHIEVEPKADKLVERTSEEIEAQAKALSDLIAEVEALEQGTAGVAEIYSGKPYQGLAIKDMSREMAIGFLRDLRILKEQLTTKEAKE